MLVGHNPVLEEALALLIRGVRAGAGAMRTGEAAELDYAPGGRSRLIGRLRMDDD
jgi:phosphohistidine phosphatase SixA